LLKRNTPDEADKTKILSLSMAKPHTSGMNEFRVVSNATKETVLPNVLIVAGPALCLISEKSKIFTFSLDMQEYVRKSTKIKKTLHLPVFILFRTIIHV
jgi:hypothetical protein